MVQRANGSDLREEIKASRKNVLFVGAHPDDIELGCLGTIMKYVDEGRSITCIIASDGEGAKIQGKKINRRQESIKTLTGAGVKEKSIIFLGIPDTMLHSHERKIFKQVEDTCINQRIGRVFMHSAKDRHQDHRAIAEVVQGAARFVPDQLLYETNSSTREDFIPQHYVEIGPYISKKVKLLKHHESQQDKEYMSLTSVASLARHRGTKSKLAYAEAFEVLRLVEV